MKTEMWGYSIRRRGEAYGTVGLLCQTSGQHATANVTKYVTLYYIFCIYSSSDVG